MRRAAAGNLPDETLVVYVSPLKALSNDVRKNLETPLQELTLRAVESGTPLQTIRTAVRTGDTTPAERAQMLRKPPHVLVTTPESLFILLTARRSRALFTSVATVIVDEIHAMAGDKRGAHLALTLARLDALVERESGRRPQRIGLSATVRPLEPVARFLSPHAQIVDVGSRRPMELRVEVPHDELGAVASASMWAEIYDRVAEIVRTHRTTLVFVGTRRMSERVAYALTERLGEGVLLPHHGSLSREARFEAEHRLKCGELRAVVATASLELGIDIGTVDVVVQLGTPRSISVALQRIGRSGHWVGATPKGAIFATTRDELIECAALVRALRGGAIDASTIPHAPSTFSPSRSSPRARRRSGAPTNSTHSRERRTRTATLARRFRACRRNARRRRRDVARAQRHVPPLRPRQRTSARTARRAPRRNHVRRRNSR